METKKVRENIFLIGFMGSGKSTMAKMLAKEMGNELVEMDETIEAEAGMSINEIFEKHGEDYFRDLESTLIERIARKGGVIVSCGGGAILREENVLNMKKSGKIIYLSATPETIYERVRHSTNRPLLKGNMNIEYITCLMEKRIDIYRSTADEVVSVDAKDKKTILEEIKAVIL